MLDLGRTFLQSVERSPRATTIVDGQLRLGDGRAIAAREDKRKASFKGS